MCLGVSSLQCEEWGKLNKLLVMSGENQGNISAIIVLERKERNWCRWSIHVSLMVILSKKRC